MCLVADRSAGAAECSQPPGRLAGVQGGAGGQVPVPAGGERAAERTRQRSGRQNQEVRRDGYTSTRPPPGDSVSQCVSLFRPKTDFSSFSLWFQTGYQADEDGEGPEPLGAAGRGRRPAGVQGEGSGAGGDGGGAAGEGSEPAEAERGAQTAPPRGQAAAAELAGQKGAAVRPHPASRQLRTEKAAGRRLVWLSAQKYVVKNPTEHRSSSATSYTPSKSAR